MNTDNKDALSALELIRKALIKADKEQGLSLAELEAFEEVFEAITSLKDAMRDVLKAICSDRHAVQDTLFVNGTPVGDFIMCALDEDIDFDALQMAPYRCKKTLELPPPRCAEVVAD